MLASVRVCVSRSGNARKKTVASFMAALFHFPMVRPVVSRTPLWNTARRPTEPCQHTLLFLCLWPRLTLQAPASRVCLQLHILRLWYRLRFLRAMFQLAPARPRHPCPCRLPTPLVETACQAPLSGSVCGCFFACFPSYCGIRLGSPGTGGCPSRPGSQSSG